MIEPDSLFAMLKLRKDDEMRVNIDQSSLGFLHPLAIHPQRSENTQSQYIYQEDQREQP
jgi:hypothetical protein